MKNNLIVKSFGYIIVFYCGFAALKYDFRIDTSFWVLLLLSLPMSMLLSNIVHELGHFLFCKVFKLKITRIVIGVLQYETTSKKFSLNGIGFLNGKCAFLIGDNLTPIKYFLVFMGGVILNIVTIIVGVMLLHIGINSILNYSIIVCCVLNVFANGLYSKSTDRKLLKEYMQKK